MSRGFPPSQFACTPDPSKPPNNSTVDPPSIAPNYCRSVVLVPFDELATLACKCSDLLASYLVPDVAFGHPYAVLSYSSSLIVEEQFVFSYAC